MDPRFRARFNEIFSDALYQNYQKELERRLGWPIPFRLAETPLFIPPELKERLVRAAEEILAQLSSPALIERMRAAVPERWDVPRVDSLPSFAQIDFAIVREEDGSLGVRLIELQGFPSLSMFQLIQRDVWNDLLSKLEGLDRNWSCWFSGLDRTSFLELVRRTIVGNHDPREVILLDLDPASQKTACDFAATKALFGVDSVDPRALIMDGRSLWRRDPADDSRSLRVRRIHNRVVFDELERLGIELPFDYRFDLDVEWAPHPNWYWIWSKYSIPFLDHPAVPRATLLSDLPAVPDDLRGFVLKPLFSFAGGGVNIDPTAEDLAGIQPEERSNWCLQEKIEYAPELAAADGGGVKAEVRMMFFRPDDEPRPILGQNLVRLSRGKMHGVDHNKGLSWVGASVGLFPG